MPVTGHEMLGECGEWTIEGISPCEMAGIAQDLLTGHRPIEWTVYSGVSQDLAAKGRKQS